MLCSVCVRRHVWGSRRPMCFARTRQNNSTHISCLFVCFLLSLTMHRCWYICVVLVCSVYRDFCANKFDPLEFIRFAADAWMFGVNCVKSTKGRCYSEAIRMAANPHDDVSFFFFVCLSILAKREENGEHTMSAASCMAQQTKNDYYSLLAALFSSGYLHTSLSLGNSTVVHYKQLLLWMGGVPSSTVIDASSDCILWMWIVRKRHEKAHNIEWNRKKKNCTRCASINISIKWK